MQENTSKHSFFLHLFPPPKFLQMPSVGLSISDKHIRFVGFKRLKKGPSLDVFGSRELPAGVVDKGYIHDSDKLVEILKDIKDEHNLQFIKTTLPEDKIYLFRTSIPWVEKKEIRGTLEFKIEENVPVNSSEAVFDYQVIKEDKAGGKINLVVSVSPIKTVEAYLQSFERAGLMPISLGIEPQAICHSVIEFNDDLTYLVLNIGCSQTGLFIASQGVVQFTSTFHFSAEGGGGSNYLNDPSVSDTVSLEEDNEKSSPDLSGWAGNSFTVRLKEEIRKVSEYWQTQDLEGLSEDKKKIRKIIMTGDVDNLEGLVAYLNDLDFLDEGVVLGNVWTNVFSLDKKIPPITFEQSLGFAAAVGQGLPENLKL